MSGAVLCLSATVNSGNAAAAILTDGSPFSYGSGIRTASYKIDADGYVYHSDNGTYTQQYAWKQSGSASDFDAYATVLSGSVSGTTGSWVNLGTDREWSVVDASNDGIDETAEMTVQIRNASTLAVLATAYINFAASRIL